MKNNDKNIPRILSVLYGLEHLGKALGFMEDFGGPGKVLVNGRLLLLQRRMCSSFVSMGYEQQQKEGTSKRQWGESPNTETTFERTLTGLWNAVDRLLNRLLKAF